MRVGAAAVAANNYQGVATTKTAMGAGGNKRSGNLPAITKLCYGAGDLAASLAYTVTALFYLYFLTDVARVPPSLAGSAILAGRLWDAITDPMEGYVSDRTRTRMGRRRPYFLYGALPFGLTFVMLWTTPALASPAAKLAYYGMALIIHLSAFTMVQVPYAALAADLTTDYDERTSLTAYRMAFSIAGGLLAAALPMAIVNAYPDAGEGFLKMAALFAIPIAASPLVTFWGCRESPESSREAGEAPLLSQVRGALRNKPFVLALGVFLLTWTAMDVVSAMFVYYLKYWLAMEQATPAVLGLLFVTSIVFLPFWLKVTAKWGKREAFIAGMSSLIIVLAVAAALPGGPTPLVYPLAVFAGVGISCAHVIPWAVIPDCLDYDRLTSAESREGVFYGLMTFLQKLASSAAMFAVGSTLDRAGYVPGVRQGPQALAVIRLLLGAGPGILFGGAAVLIAFYPISREYHRRIVEALAARATSSPGELQVDIVEVVDASLMRQFIRLPWRLYRDDPNWVPPLLSDMWNTLMGKDNPQFNSGPHTAFLAYLKGAPAGRICAGLNEKLNALHARRDGYITLFESIDDDSVATALFSAAEQWLKGHGATTVKGPISPTNGDDYRGLLIEGFDSPPVLLNSYNPPYYQRLFQANGYVKDIDLFAYRCDLSQIDVHEKIVRYAMNRYGFTVRPVDLGNLDSELAYVKRVIDRAMPAEWEDMTPPRMEEIRNMANRLRGLIVPEFVQVAFAGDEPVGLCMGMPDYNQALMRMNGRLFPFGWLVFLLTRRRIKAGRVFVMFVVPEYRKKGVSFALYHAVLEAARQKGYLWGEGSTIGETNLEMRRDIERAGGVHYKTYRIFKKDMIDASRIGDINGV